APPRQADRGEGDLSRSCPLLARAFCQSQRPALDQPDAVGPDPLGGAGLGVALSDGAGALGALCSRTRTAAQDPDRLGPTDGPASPPLDGTARAGAGCRQQLCRSGAAGRLGPARGDLHHPAAPGCGFIQTGAAAPSRNKGTPADQGHAPAQACRSARGGDNALADHPCVGPVWPGGSRHRVLLGHRRVASCRIAGRADPLGSAARSAGPLRSAGLLVHRSGPPTPADPDLVHPALAGRGHLPRGARPSRGREPVGVESQRQWSERAIARTTPCLLALFWLVALLATHLDTQVQQTVATAAWYRKRHPTFADTLAAVRRQFWCEQGLFTSHPAAEEQKSQPALHNAIAHAICYAA